MVVDIYNGIYGVPGKCGSRYWSETDKLGKWKTPTILRVDFKDLYSHKLSLEWMVIRNPLSHLESALQTEVMECFDDSDKIFRILKSFVEVNNGGTHFHPHFCKLVYSMWCNNGFNLKIIELGSLTEFLKTIGFDIPYNSKNYDFHNDTLYKSKSEIWNRCVDLYPDLMNELINYTTNDIKYYNALLNGDMSLVKLPQPINRDTKKFL